MCHRLLEWLLGERKIDLLIEKHHDPRPIVDISLQKIKASAPFYKAQSSYDLP